jgi:DNA primase
MTLKDYVITYSVDDKIVANLYDYYEVFIKKLDPRFEQYSYYSSNLVLCYFKDHADVNPSMGWIKDKRLKGVKVCHCFGCGKTADVVRLHQILSSQYLDKELSEKDACIEVASMFNIPLDDFNELEDDDFEGHYLRNLRRIDSLKSRYTVREFSQGVYDLRMKSSMGNVDLNKLNSESVKMIATVKQLYD